MTVTTMAIEFLTHGTGWGPGPWWPIFPLVWLLLWGAVIFAVFRWARGRRAQRPRSGEEVLGERYARGEINEDEYRERLAVLRNAAS